MSGLEDIDIQVEGPASAPSTGNALPLLHEIRHALERLLEDGASTVIDLGAMPLAPQDERQLLDQLGTGEVEARLKVLGSSVVRETGVGGVWLVEHANAAGEPIGRFIEVGFVPAILRSQPEDVRDGLDHIAHRLSQEPVRLERS